MFTPDIIERFPADYQQDYCRVFRLSLEHFNAEAGAVTVPPLQLASVLNHVLRAWGAGRRKAPEPAADEVTARMLVEHRAVFIQLIQVSLKVIQDEPDLTAFSLESTHQAILHILLIADSQMLVGNTNITYPSKILLLLTGVAAALDSQVRAGLRTQFPGFSGTQYLMPRRTMDPGYRKYRLAMERLYPMASKALPGVLAAVRERDVFRTMYDGGRLLTLGRLIDMMLFIKGR